MAPVRWDASRLQDLQDLLGVHAALPRHRLLVLADRTKAGIDEDQCLVHCFDRLEDIVPSNELQVDASSDKLNDPLRLGLHAQVLQISGGKGVGREFLIGDLGEL